MSPDRPSVWDLSRCIISLPSYRGLRAGLLAAQEDHPTQCCHESSIHKAWFIVTCVLPSIRCLRFLYCFTDWWKDFALRSFWRRSRQNNLDCPYIGFCGFQGRRGPPQWKIWYDPSWEPKGPPIYSFIVKTDSDLNRDWSNTALLTWSLRHVMTRAH